MSLSVRPQQSEFAAEISGVRLADELSQDVVDAIVAAIDRYAIVVFRDQPLTDEQQLAFGRRLGILQSAVKRLRDDEKQRLRFNELIDVSNLDEKGAVLDAVDRRRLKMLGNRLWHTDASFQDPRGRYSMLSARAVPTTGGQTEYADLRAAYDALSDAEKTKLDGMIAEHSIIYSRESLGYTDYKPAERAALPPVRHPVVGVHPGSKRKTLYIAAHASHILGQPVPEGRMLLRDLIEFATQREFVYQHQWRVGDFVIWDNRCTMHRGLPYDETQVRDMRRITTVDYEPALTGAGASG